MGSQRSFYEPTHFVNVKIENRIPFIHLLNIFWGLTMCQTVLAATSVPDPLGSFLPTPAMAEQGAVDALGG